ncbi:MAG: histidine kinase dimerization/phospho-acceptor domain-containing protein, partial [Pseudomonadota bacterium]
MTNRMHTSQNNLERAFLAFNQHSLQLETAYRALQIKVSQLSGELAAARSERQREREEKERIAGRMAHLLDALPGGVLVLDADGIVAETNPAARDLLGEPLDGECWLDVLERACVAEPETNGELVLRNGRRISVSRRNLDGERGQLLLLADVTETRNLQSMLERNDRLTELGEMAASLAHQIRTPLSSAVLYASQLHRPALERAEQRQFSGRIVSRLKHLERLVNDMLVYARGGRAGQASFDAADVTAEAVRLVRAQLGDNVSMTVSVPEQALPVSGNRDALAGALANLLTNGRQAAGEDARLALTVSQAEDGGAVFEVADNGPGIAEDNAARLFEPFFTTRPDGTG